MTIQKLFLTFMGTGLSPKYPEIVTTTVALLLGIALLHTVGMETLFMATLAVALISIFEINKYLNAQPEPFEEAEKNGIVIDKAAGVWLTLLISWSTALSLSFPYAQELAAFFSFVSFLLFDSWKPSTIGWISRNVKGGLGVVGSAVLSGFAGGFLTVVILMGIEKVF